MYTRLQNRLDQRKLEGKAWITDKRNPSEGVEISCREILMAGISEFEESGDEETVMEMYRVEIEAEV